jgi:hypothetical protein
MKNRMNFLLKMLPGLACVGLTLVFAGCGEADPFEHVGVSGKVTLNGEPLDGATITFVPTVTGAGAHGQISAGTYKIGRSEGPGPGSYRIEISKNVASGRKIPDPEYPGKMMEETQNLIPPQYNINSDLKVDVKNEAEQVFDFSIETKARGK